MSVALLFAIACFPMAVSAVRVIQLRADLRKVEADIDRLRAQESQPSRPAPQSYEGTVRVSLDNGIIAVSLWSRDEWLAKILLTPREVEPLVASLRANASAARAWHDEQAKEG